MLIECHNYKARVDAEEIGVVEEEGFPGNVRTYLLRCGECNSALVGQSDEDISRGIQPDGMRKSWGQLVRVHPKPRRLLGTAIPETVRQSLEEAERCMQVAAFLASAAMAGRALEAVCRHHSTEDTYLGAGIKELREKGIIDARLFEWSEELRDQRNKAAHASDTSFSSQDAEDILTFTYAIVDYVFLLTLKFEPFQDRKKKADEERRQKNRRNRT